MKTSQRKTIVIGLTGSIGMGKSTVAKMFSALGLPILSADKVVHGLLAPGGAAEQKVLKVFPESKNGKRICRRRLGRAVFGQPKRLAALEKILHPLVEKAEKDFIRSHKQNKAPGVVLEIPLLFETGAEKRCDVVCCVSAPKAVQKARVLQRKNMTPAKLKAILNNQMPEAEKKKRADFVVQTGTDLATTRKQVRALWQQISSGI